MGGGGTKKMSDPCRGGDQINLNTSQGGEKKKVTPF